MNCDRLTVSLCFFRIEFQYFSFVQLVLANAQQLWLHSRLAANDQSRLEAARRSRRRRSSESANNALSISLRTARLVVNRTNLKQKKHFKERRRKKAKTCLTGT